MGEKRKAEEPERAAKKAKKEKKDKKEKEEKKDETTTTPTETVRVCVPIAKPLSEGMCCCCCCCCCYSLGFCVCACVVAVAPHFIPTPYTDTENLTKKILSLVKYATKNKTMVRGIKEVTKLVRKKKVAKNSLVVLAADISPLDVIAHMPVLLDDEEVFSPPLSHTHLPRLCVTHAPHTHAHDTQVRYMWVPSRSDLGASTLSKRPTSAVLIKKVRFSLLPHTSCPTLVSCVPVFLHPASRTLSNTPPHAIRCRRTSRRLSRRC